MAHLVLVSKKPSFLAIETNKKTTYEKRFG